MLSPNLFIIFGVLLGLISIRTLLTVVRKRRELFDKNFTAADRSHLSEAAFFLLLPISVLLHEAGHALAVRAFGGEVLDFGWYLFYGYVEHQGFYRASDLFWIALSGNLVSIGLGLIAIAVPLLRPMRAPLNYLLLVFGAASLLNSIVFYPLLDFAGGMAGDWSQIYIRDTFTLSAITGAVHGLLVLASLIAWRSDAARRLYAVRTGRPANALRRLTKTQAASDLLSAGEALSARWRHPLRVVVESQGQATGVSLRWISNGYGRFVAVFATVEGQRHIEILGGIQLLDGSGQTFQRPIARIEGIPSTDALEPALARLLEQVDEWDMQAVEQPI